MRSLRHTDKKLEATRDLINKRFDQLRAIVDTLNRFGVTDDELRDAPNGTHTPMRGLAGSLEVADEESMAMAMDLCNILNSSEQPSRWRFRRKPKEETTQALLRQLIVYYGIIAG